MSTEIELLKQTVDQYFDVLYFCDLDKFDSIFAASCTLQTVRDGKLSITPIAEYRQILAQRTSPDKLNSLREDRVAYLDMVEDCCALAKLRVRISDREYQDYLSLLWCDGRWQIVSKVYALAA